MNSQSQAPQEGSSAQSEQVCLGTVARVRGDVVVVDLDSNEQCGTCVSKSHCNMSQSDSSRIELEAAGFRKGDRVHVKSQPGAMLKVSIALYVFPVLLVIIGSFAGYLAFEEFLGWPGDYGSLAGVVLGLLLSVLFVHFYRAGRAGGPPKLTLEKIEVEE